MLSADRGESADRIAHPEYYERPALNLSASEPPQDISLANSAIYTSHRLSTWGQRTWKVCQWDVTSTACIPFLLAGFLQRALPVRTFLATKHCFCNMYILQICAVAFSALSAVVGYHVPQGFLGSNNLHNRYWQHKQCKGSGLSSISRERMVEAFCLGTQRHLHSSTDCTKGLYYDVISVGKIGTEI